MSTIDQSISRRLLFAIILTAITLVGEIVGGIWSNSLALLSDAGHVFLDLFALLLSLGAIKLAAQPASGKHSYGWHRAEVLAALINGLTVYRHRSTDSGGGRAGAARCSSYSHGRSATGANSREGCGLSAYGRRGC